MIAFFKIKIGLSVWKQSGSKVITPAENPCSSGVTVI